MFPTSAFAVFRDLPLVSGDSRVIKGNAIFEENLRILENELDMAVEEFARKLRPDVQVFFDENQMDWKVYFETEKVAFKPTNVWTRGSRTSEKYENLYQQNVLFALNFRIEQIKSFKDKTITEPCYNENVKKVLPVEIEEAKYRADLWTEERLRYRLYRAEKAWDIYRSSLNLFVEKIGWDQTRLMELDFLLLEYRFALLSKQREALFRLKYEVIE